MSKTTSKVIKTLDKIYTSQKELSNIMFDAGVVYAGEVISDRAIPDLVDGLKPVQRRILYTMGKHFNLHHKAKHTKSARVVGETMGRYHPHGDSSIYEALINLSQDWNTLIPLIEVQGNNGGISEAVTHAAMRYTETRLTKPMELVLLGLKKNVIKYKPTYDLDEEPKVLPAMFPIALTNGSTGIAWGLATSILPHNVLELLDASIQLVKRPDLTTKQLMKWVKGPDFPTGAIIEHTEGIYEDLDKGKGKIILRAKVEIEQRNKAYILHIKELPYKLTLEAVIDSINDVLLVNDGAVMKNLGIVNVINESQGNIPSIIVEFTKSSTKKEVEKTLNYLYTKTKLRTSITSSNVMIYKGHPGVFGLKSYLLNFLDFRRLCLKREWEFDINLLEDRLEIVEGLFKLYDITDEVVAIAKKSKGKSKMEQALVDKYQFTKRQAEVISTMQLYRLGLDPEELKILKQERKEIKERIKELNLRLKDKEVADNCLIEELKATKLALKEVGARKSIILEVEDELVDIKPTELEVVEKDIAIVVKDRLQLFTLGVKALENQLSNYKEKDIVFYQVAKNTDYINAITRSGGVVTRLIHDCTSGNLNGKFVEMNKEVDKLLANDVFIGASVGNPVELKRYKDSRVVLLTKFGYIKVVEANTLCPNISTKRYAKNLGKAFNFKQVGDEVIWVGHFDKVANLKQSQLQFRLVDNKTGKVLKVKGSDKEGFINLKLSKFAARQDTSTNGGVKIFDSKNGSILIEEMSLKLI